MLLRIIVRILFMFFTISNLAIVVQKMSQFITIALIVLFCWFYLKYQKVTINMLFFASHFHLTSGFSLTLLSMIKLTTTYLQYGNLKIRSLGQ